jgi:hypothetical protein
MLDAVIDPFMLDNAMLRVPLLSDILLSVVALPNRPLIALKWLLSRYYRNAQGAKVISAPGG